MSFRSSLGTTSPFAFDLETRFGPEWPNFVSKRANLRCRVPLSLSLGTITLPVQKGFNPANVAIDVYHLTPLSWKARQGKNPINRLPAGVRASQTLFSILSRWVSRCYLDSANRRVYSARPSSEPFSPRVKSRRLKAKVLPSFLSALATDLRKLKLVAPLALLPSRHHH